MNNQRHSIRYSFLLLAAAICILAPNAHAQYCACDPKDAPVNDDWFVVNAPSGLILRAGPSRNSAKLSSIPFGEEVLVCRATTVKETIEGIESNWVKVSWAEKSGYLFGGFLKKEEHRKVRLFMPSVGIHSDWLCAELSSEVQWEALLDTVTTVRKYYEPKPAFFVSKPVKLGRKKRHKDCGGEGYFENAPVNMPKAPFAIIGGCKLVEKVVNHVRTPIRLLPGEISSFTLYNHEKKLEKTYFITAEGNVINNEQFLLGDDYRGPISRIEPYKVKLYEQITERSANGSENTSFKMQRIYEGKVERTGDLDGWNVKLEMEVFSVIFAGDMDGDDELDLILRSGNGYSLYLSSKKLPGFLIRYMASWQDSDC